MDTAEKNRRDKTRPGKGRKVDELSPLLFFKLKLRQGD